MLCADLDDLIEPIAAGELEPGGEIRAHLATCRSCAGALALAQRIDHVLASQPLPQPAAGFTAALMTRVRRERWRSEQYLDVAFNVAVGLAVTVGLGGLWLVLTASGLATVSADLTRLMLSSAGAVLSSMAPALPLYALAAVVFVGGMALWWWAEQGFEI